LGLRGTDTLEAGARHDELESLALSIGETGRDYPWARMSNVLWLLLGLLVLAGTFAVPIWALRRQNRMFPEGRDRISRDPEAAQATRRFETMWTFFSGRSGSG
jgi:hypothetical protein